MTNSKAKIEKKLTEFTKLLKGEPYLSTGAKAMIVSYSAALLALQQEAVEEAIMEIPHRYCESENKKDNLGNPYPCNCGVEDYIDSKLSELKGGGK